MKCSRGGEEGRDWERGEGEGGKGEEGRQRGGSGRGEGEEGRGRRRGREMGGEEWEGSGKRGKREREGEGVSPVLCSSCSEVGIVCSAVGLDMKLIICLLQHTKHTHTHNCTPPHFKHT